MASIVSTGDNSVVPFARAETYTPDQLIGGDLKLVTQPILVSGGAFKRGTVLGQIASVPAVATAGESNVGDGTIGSLTVADGALVGVYTLTATNATTFAVTDPEGASLGNATAGTAFSDGGLGFKVTAGSTAFVAGDTFSISLLDVVGTLTASVPTATDGSQTPVAILVDDVDASAGEVTGDGYFMGEFNARALIHDAAWTLPALTAALRPAGIFVKTSISAADPV